MKILLVAFAMLVSPLVGVGYIAAVAYHSAHLGFGIARAHIYRSLRTIVEHFPKFGKWAARIDEDSK